MNRDVKVHPDVKSGVRRALRAALRFATRSPAKPAKRSGDTMQRDFELSIQRVYQAALRDGDIAIDVGAHIGGHTFPMAQALAPRGKVYAVEPLPSCRNSLSNGLTYQFPQLKPVVEILDCALSEYEGESEFIVAVDAPWFSGLQKRVYDSPTALEKIPIQVRTIDGLFLELPALRYIKVDAEGGEFHIFKGAAQCIEKFRPLVSFEFGANTLAEYKITCADMAEFWFSRGYRIYDVDNELMATREVFVQSAEHQRVWDYLAVPAENAELDSIVQEALKEKAMS
jgi:FkbM family methyltransferase